MDKPTKKRNSYNTEIIKVLSEEFVVTERFVRMCVSGDKQSLTAETIKKKYNELANPSQKAIENFKNQPL
ncbi:hypothetical protein EIB75_10815 [Epilithonimonas vandammei]|uniref:Uncharacterized protein n=2 Tax=Epilithonimonas vandammei TaxID=2487072 RepID=A0A3G8ZH91_9FLAO|nr:hypothetical protein EIB75_00735 [Epilithonimonas vandammei]AZI56752.1 hypothetical protein EIB75_10815 [Epilithonimonas vandammei]